MDHLANVERRLAVLPAEDGADQIVARLFAPRARDLHRDDELEHGTQTVGVVEQLLAVGVVVIAIGSTSA